MPPQLVVYNTSELERLLLEMYMAKLMHLLMSVWVALLQQRIIIIIITVAVVPGGNNSKRQERDSLLMLVGMAQQL